MTFPVARSCDDGVSQQELGLLGRAFTGSLQVVQELSIVPKSQHPRNKLKGTSQTYGHRLLLTKEWPASAHGKDGQHQFESIKGLGCKTQSPLLLHSIDGLPDARCQTQQKGALTPPSLYACIVLSSLHMSATSSDGWSSLCCMMFAGSMQ